MSTTTSSNSNNAEVTPPPLPPMNNQHNVLSNAPDQKSVNDEIRALVGDLSQTKERVVSSVPAPIVKRLTMSEVFDKEGKPRLKVLREHFFGEGALDVTVAMELIRRAGELFRREPNVLTLQDPITVCGDIHGQYYDLVKLFEIGGDPSETQYLFLGDYVDRGYFSTECCLYLYAVKMCYPDTFFMLRGNHECAHLTSYFNFKQECKYKYDLQVYECFITSFDSLPLAAILNTKFLCVHGGLSPDVQTVEDLRNLHRFRDIPPSGPMCDILWSDPMDEEEEDNTPDALYLHNDLRGCSYVFSYNAVCTFLRNNNLLSLIRAHEAQDEGYRLYKKSSSTGFPTIICIFSAPNYCDVYNNKGAIIRFQNNLMNIRQFNSSPHPYNLPNFMNAFTWSLPFVAEKVTDMLHTMWNLIEDDEDDESDDSENDDDFGLAVSDDDNEGHDKKEKAKKEKKPKAAKPKKPVSTQNTLSAGQHHKFDLQESLNERGDVIRKKVLAVGRLCRLYKTIREESENIVLLKGLAGGKVPHGLISQGADAIQQAITTFQQAKKADAHNERRPPLLNQ